MGDETNITLKLLSLFNVTSSLALQLGSRTNFLLTKEVRL